jgi:hypothetical protein
MSASNIRVFVQWKNATVFAGEDVECTITFKNVALPEGRGRSPGRGQNGFAPGGERLRKLPPVHSSTRPSVSRNSSFASQIAPPSQLRGHRPALSLNTPINAGERRLPASQTGAFSNNAGGHSHGRSLSIISLGTDAATEVNREKSATPGRPMRGHARSGSLQIVPGRPNSYPGTVRGHCKLLKLTQYSQLTGPSISDTSFASRHGSLVTTSRPGQLERIRIPGTTWEETSRNHDYAKHTPTSHDTKGFQFFFQNFQISSRPSIRSEYLARTTECLRQCANADERTTTTLSTPKREFTNTHKPHRFAVAHSSHYIRI